MDPAGFTWTAISAASAAIDGSIRLEIEPHFTVCHRSCDSP
jgi:hypothetical protein